MPDIAPLVVVDTTATQMDWTLAGASWAKLLSMADRGLIELAIPKIVLMEGARQISDRIGTAHRNMLKQAGEVSRFTGQLSAVGVGYPHRDKVPEWNPPSRDAVVHGVTKRIQASKGEVLPIPDLAHDVLIDRDLDGLLPFQSNGKGYRDALIWLSIVERAEQCADGQQLYFISGNSKDYLQSDGLHPALRSELPEAVRDGFTFVDTMGELLNRPEFEIRETQIKDSARSGSVAMPATVDLKWPSGPGRAGSPVEDLGTGGAVAQALASAADELAGQAVATHRRHLDDVGLDFTQVDFPESLFDATIDHFEPKLDSAVWTIYETSSAPTQFVEATLLTDVLFTGVMETGDYYFGEPAGVTLLEEITGTQFCKVATGNTIVLVFRAEVIEGSGMVSSVEFDHARQATEEELDEYRSPSQ